MWPTSPLALDVSGRQTVLPQDSVGVARDSDRSPLRETQELYRARGTVGDSFLPFIVATGNSQLHFMAALGEKRDIEWDRVVVFHMDEYLGMSEQHPASFRRYIGDELINVVGPRQFFGIRGEAADLEAELLRYRRLLEHYPPDACVMGIGDNGHLAFNDPPGDFATDEVIGVVDLDEMCRQQQVNEGHFETLHDVPKRALSLTVPGLEI